MELPECEYLTVREAARYIGASAQFLNKKRCESDGPEFIRISARAIRYRKIDLDRWMDHRRASSTREYAAEPSTEAAA